MDLELFSFLQFFVFKLVISSNSATIITITALIRSFILSIYNQANRKWKDCEKSLEFVWYPFTPIWPLYNTELNHWGFRPPHVRPLNKEAEQSQKRSTFFSKTTFFILLLSPSHPLTLIYAQAAAPVCHSSFTLPWQRCPHGESVPCQLNLAFIPSLPLAVFIIFSFLRHYRWIYTHLIQFSAKAALPSASVFPFPEI